MIAVAGVAFSLRMEAIERIRAFVKPAAPAPIRPGRSATRDRYNGPLVERLSGFDEPFTYYRHRRIEDWQPVDGYMLGKTLIERGRIALARAAFEAARRIDANHPETIEALASLESPAGCGDSPAAGRAARRPHPYRAASIGSERPVARPSGARCRSLRARSGSRGGIPRPAPRTL